MDFALQPRFYAHVPVWLWPWVLWQILRVMAWSDGTGRAVSFSINENGQLYVDYIADDPRIWNEQSLGRYTCSFTGQLARLSISSPDSANSSESWSPSPSLNQTDLTQSSGTGPQLALGLSEPVPKLKKPHPEPVEGRRTRDEGQRIETSFPLSANACENRHPSPQVTTKTKRRVQELDTCLRRYWRNF